jgi:mRNA-degrading endonuclease RelE of RelBE toxin-antitoxin system
MKFRTAWSAQAEAYLKSLAPQPRSAARVAIRALAQGSGRAETRALEGRLQGYFRLRFGTHRIIYRIRADANGPLIDFIFAGPRSTVYEAFEAILADELSLAGGKK